MQNTFIAKLNQLISVFDINYVNIYQVCFL